MPITFFGFTIYEPMTVLTNLILAFMCWWIYEQQKEGNRNWAYFFLFLSLSTLSAAVGHGYSELLDNPVKFFSRAFALVSVYFGGFASIQILGREQLRLVLKWVLLIQSVVFFAWLVMDNTFLPIKFNSILGLGIIVLGIHLHSLATNKDTRDMWIVLGIIINASAAIVNTYKWNLSPNFTYHDIGHVIMMIGIIVMYQGVSKYKLIHAT